MHSEIDPEWLAGVDSVGVTSGASVPDDLVQGVLDYLVDQGLSRRPRGAAHRGVTGLRAAARAA